MMECCTTEQNQRHLFMSSLKKGQNGLKYSRNAHRVKMLYFHFSPQKVHVTDEISDVCVCVWWTTLTHTECLWQSHFIKITIYCFLQKRSQIVSLSVSQQQHSSLQAALWCSWSSSAPSPPAAAEFVRFSLSNLRTFLLIVMKISEGWKPLNAFNLSKCLRRAFNMCAQNSLCNLIVLIASANGLSKR